jgi:hypothetical protein
MTQEEKDLLLKDLSARLPYGIMITMGGRPPMRLEYIHNDWDFGDAYCMCSEFQYEIEECKPYLRPLSSMTEEEKHKLLKFGAITCLENGEVIDVSCVGFERHADVQDYLNAHHFDYRGLIEKGLAIAVTKENNPYK